MDTEAMVKRIAVEAWQCPPERVQTDDFSEFYPWLTQHRVYIAGGPVKRTAFVVVDSHGATLAFFHEKAQMAANVQTLNRLLQSAGAALPDLLAPLYLAKTVRDFLLGTQGFVGSADFWEEQGLNMDDWAGALPPEQSAVLFKKYCRDPALVRLRQDWTLDFFFFNRIGEVEKWTVSGGPGQIREAGFQVAEPAKTFHFPYV